MSYFKAHQMGAVVALLATSLAHGADSTGAQEPLKEQVAGEAATSAPTDADASSANAAPDRSVAVSPDTSSAGDSPSAPVESAVASTVPVEGSPAEPEAATEKSERHGGIQEIIVTAQKTAENIQDVPISIQAFSADQLDAAGISSTQNLPKITPGMAYTSYAGYSIVYIRGVGTDAFLAADPGVPTYIDGVYYPFNQNLAASLGSVERIEVLKGPQGTLFGRNATGGAINIVTRQPDDEFRTELSTGYEKFDNVRTRALVNIPLADGLSLLASGVYNYEPSYYKRFNTPLKGDIDETVTRAASVKMKWSAGQFSSLLGFSYLANQGEMLTMIPIENVKPMGTLLGVEEAPAYRSSQDFRTGADTTTRVLEAHLEYGFDWFDARVIGADTTINSPAGVDFDGSNKPLVTFFAPGQISNQKSAELQLVSNTDSWGSDWLKWVGGFLYVDSLQGWDPLQLYVAPNVVSFLAAPPPSLGLGGLTTPLTSGLQTLAGAAGIPFNLLLNNGVSLQGYDQIATKSYSWYAQATADVTDWLSFTVGGRYQEEKRGLAVATTYVTDPVNPDNSIQAFDWNDPSLGGPHRAKYHNFSPKGVIQVHADDDNMLFFSYGKGYQGGTFNTVNIYVAPTYVKPSSNTAFELGYKGSLLDGSLRLDAGIFQNELHNVQVQFISLLTGGAVRYETAPEARIRGLDFSAMWEPLPNALPGLLTTVSGAYLDGKYTDYPVGSGFDPDTGLYFGGTSFPNGGVTPGRDFTGNRTVRTPKYSGNLTISYTFDVGDGTLELSNATYYNSGFYFQAQNTPSSKQESYVLDDVRASYLYNPWDFRLSLYGRNIGDTKYYVNRTDIDFGTSSLLAPPLVYGIELQWQF